MGKQPRKSHNHQLNPRVLPQPITEEMHRSYLDYAMSVIVARALPDVRDGLKPVHRRILYAMWRLRLTHESKYRKSATVVGEVLGKFHPHGDIPVYEALVRMAQPFSMRYPLIDGQGNFGSLDGDPPAAMRYTEARLQKITAEMLSDIDKETVSWRPNYDNTRKEPAVLPSKLPQLILNGSLGIAVGMTTNIPPHNLREVVDALNALIEEPNLTTSDLLKFIKGPDFPTGGYIYDKKAILETYSQGRGSFVCRAAAEIEKTKQNNYRIIVREIVWQVNKATLIEKIAALVKTKRLSGIKYIRDESAREGVRIVIGLKKNFQPKKILNKLFKLTDLQKSYHLNMLALVEGIQPQVLSLKDVLGKFIEYRLEVIRKRSVFELKEAEKRAHLLEGFSQALQKIDQVIAVIKKAKDREAAKINLIKRFNFSQEQTEAILQMRLQSLAALERRKIQDELKEKKALIKRLKILLANPKKIKKVLKEELLELKEKYGDQRRTKVIDQPLKQIKEEELVQERGVLVFLTKNGYIKRVQPEAYRKQHRAGYGMLGIITKEKDLVKHFFSASTTDWVLFFTNRGKVFKLRVYEIPEGSRVSKGKPIVNLLELASEETITAVLVLTKEDFENKKDSSFIAMATKNGIIKKTPIKSFENLRHSGIRAIKLQKNDILGWAEVVSKDEEIFLVSRKGQAIRFTAKEIRSMGRNSYGVRGIRLRNEDEVKSMEIIRKTTEEKLIIISERGLGKITPIKKFRPQRRGGFGLRAIRITPRTGPVAQAKIIAEQDKELIVISRFGKVIRTTLKNIPVLSRNAQGVRIMSLKEGDGVADFITF